MIKIIKKQGYGIFVGAGKYVKEEVSKEHVKSREIIGVFWWSHNSCV